MTAKKRIAIYLKYKGISQYEFSRRTGLSNGFLNSGENITSANLDVITNAFKDLNLTWLVKGAGPMVITEELLRIPHNSEVEGSLNTATEQYIQWIVAESDEPIQSLSTAQLIELNKISKRLIRAKNETIKAKEDKIEALERLIAEKTKTDMIKDRLIQQLDKG